MDPHAMGLQQQGGGMSMPMNSIAMQQNPQAAMAMGMNGMYPQQQMMMNMQPMAQPQPTQQQMPMNSMAMSQMAQPQPTQQQQQQQGADWRIQLTREHRANLIAKIYNEMVRVSADPVPGIKLWMNVSWYELSLYKESPTQEVYINKIFTRLKSLRAQQSDMNAAMAAQALPNQGMLSRLDFSYYNTLNLGQRGANGQVSSYPGHGQFSGPGPHPGAQQQQQQQSRPTSAASTPVKTEAGASTNSAAEYWQQHAALRAKHQGDVEKVHSAFKKYVDHMKGHDETEQKKKLRYLLSYVELCANILSEDKATHPARKIEELDKVFKYIVKIVNPYLKKLRTETDKRSYPGAEGSSGSVGPPSTSAGPTSSGAPTSVGSSTMPAATSSGFSAAMTQPQPAGQNQQQGAVNTSASMQQTPQQKQQQYMMQQRAQQMQQQQQQQQQMQRQQQMMQQQQMMRQQQMQQKPQQQQQFSAQQASQMNQQQQNSQNAANQQSGQQTQQQMGQQVPSRAQQGHQPQQNPAQQQRPPPQPQKPQQTQPQPQPQQSQQPPTSRGESPSIGSGLGLTLDDSLYGSMGNDLLQMPTPSGTSSGLMDFSSALSPTSFGGMDLLDWDDGAAGQGTSGSGGTSGGDSADLMTFVETL